MADLDIFVNQFQPNVETSTLTVGGWRSYAAKHPGGNYAKEIAVYDKFVADLKAGTATTVPASPVANPSKVYNYLIAAAALALPEAAPVPDPVPVPDPTPVPTPTPTPVSISDLKGVCLYKAADVPLLAANGAKSIRCDWGTGLTILPTARNAGIDVLLIADYAMGLSSRGDKFPPDDFNAWANKVAQGVQSNNLPYIEIWNEPWLSSFWGPTPDPAAYLNLVKTTATKVWAVKPTCRIIVSCDYNANMNVVGHSDPLWRKHLLESDTTKFLTNPLVSPSTHNYCQKLAPDQNVTDAQNGFQRYEQCYADLKAHGHPDPKVWVTEYGWVSNTSGGWGDFQVTEQQQSDYVTSAIKIAQASKHVERMYRFYMQQSNTWNYNDLRPDNSQKPIMAAVKNLS
jgi:hypothetical protein